MICSISHKPWRKAIGLLSQVQKTNDVTISSLPKAVFSFKLVTWTKDHKDKLSFLTTTYVSIGQCLVYPPCRFSELCSTLEPGRPARTDKLAILGDAIRVVNQLKSEALEYKETNEKLLEEIKTLKVRTFLIYRAPEWWILISPVMIALKICLLTLFPRF